MSDTTQTETPDAEFNVTPFTFHFGLNQEHVDELRDSMKALNSDVYTTTENGWDFWDQPAGQGGNPEGIFHVHTDVPNYEIAALVADNVGSRLVERTAPGEDGVGGVLTESDNHDEIVGRLVTAERIAKKLPEDEEYKDLKDIVPGPVVSDQFDMGAILDRQQAAKMELHPDEAHPLAGQTVKVVFADDSSEHEFVVEDWADRVWNGQSWGEQSDNPTATIYALRAATDICLPYDNDVIYGKLDGNNGALVHSSEVQA